MVSRVFEGNYPGWFNRRLENTAILVGPPISRRSHFPVSFSELPPRATHSRLPRVEATQLQPTAATLQLRGDEAGEPSTLPWKLTREKGGVINSIVASRVTRCMFVCLPKGGGALNYVPCCFVGGREAFACLTGWFGWRLQQKDG